MAFNRLRKEFTNLVRSPLDGMTMSLVDDFDLYHWQATIFGPEKTVYEGGIFHLDIKIPANYPFLPPKYIFTTKILHPNIDAEGYISLDILREYWAPALTLSRGLLAIEELLRNPNFDDVLVPSIAQIYKKNPVEFKAIAREWTQKYAI